MMNSSNYDKINESKLLSIDILTNKEYLEKRQKDLIDIKLATKQIKEITEEMGNKLKGQGDLIGKWFFYFILIFNRIDDIETNLNDVKNNVEKADNLLEEEGVYKKKTIFDTRTKCMIAAIILVIIIIIVFIILIFWLIN